MMHGNTEHEIWYWKNLARYYYLVSIGQVTDIDIYEKITDNMEEAYNESCERKDMWRD